MKTKSVNTTTKEIRSVIANAFYNACTNATRVCGQYIAFYPDDTERRKRDLEIEIVGIENLYQKILKELERMEKISRSGGSK